MKTEIEITADNARPSEYMADAVDVDVSMGDVTGGVTLVQAQYDGQLQAAGDGWMSDDLERALRALPGDVAQAAMMEIRAVACAAVPGYRSIHGRWEVAEGYLSASESDADAV